jgi:hypothetical protein
MTRLGGFKNSGFVSSKENNYSTDFTTMGAKAVKTIVRAMTLLLFMTLSVHAQWFDGYVEPDDWRKKYKDVNGVDCCGDKDCVKIQVRVIDPNFIALRETDQLVQVEVSRIQGKDGIWRSIAVGTFEVPAKAVHMSEDEFAWWCHKDSMWVDGARAGGECFNSKDVFVNPKCMRCIFLNYGM